MVCNHSQAASPKFLVDNLIVLNDYNITSCRDVMPGLLLHELNLGCLSFRLVLLQHLEVNCFSLRVLQVLKRQAFAEL